MPMKDSYVNLRRGPAAAEMSDEGHSLSEANMLTIDGNETQEEELTERDCQRSLLEATHKCLSHTSQQCQGTMPQYAVSVGRTVEAERESVSGGQCPRCGTFFIWADKSSGGVAARNATCPACGQRTRLPSVQPGLFVCAFALSLLVTLGLLIFGIVLFAGADKAESGPIMGLVISTLISLVMSLVPGMLVFYFFRDVYNVPTVEHKRAISFEELVEAELVHTSVEAEPARQESGQHQFSQLPQEEDHSGSADIECGVSEDNEGSKRLLVASDSRVGAMKETVDGAECPNCHTFFVWPRFQTVRHRQTSTTQVECPSCGQKARLPSTLAVVLGSFTGLLMVLAGLTFMVEAIIGLIHPMDAFVIVIAVMTILIALSSAVLGGAILFYYIFVFIPLPIINDARRLSSSEILNAEFINAPTENPTETEAITV